MRVSQKYKLGRNQADLDFVDVPLHTDLSVFVEPAAIRSLGTNWSNQCVSLLQNFFGSVLQAVKDGNKELAIRQLASLRERNEFHLGFSKGRSRGHAFGTGSAVSVWSSLLGSKAAKSGILKDLEDTALLIDGVGTDMISDAVCNVIRGPLVEYTQQMCAYYGIPLKSKVSSGPIWDAHAQDWTQALVDLPMPEGEKLILVPKMIVRHSATYDVGEYYRHYLLPELQHQHLAAGTSLVQVLKNGKRRVTKKALKEEYGQTKASVSDLTEQNPNVLAKYKRAKAISPSLPLSHHAFAELENTPSPNLMDLYKVVISTPPGNHHATAYERAVEQLLTALFYPSLAFPSKQQPLHDGRKRLDLMYNNVAREGFFAWVAANYTAPYVFVECKNYREDIANPELDQISGRFGPSRGKFGLLICRSVEDRKKISGICRDTALDGRGYIIVLDDEDLRALVDSYAAIHSDGVRTLLNERFNAIVL